MILTSLALGACTTPAPVLVPRVPDASLLVPCETPSIPPERPTNIESSKGYVEAVRIALDCKAKDDALIQFEKAAPTPK